MTHSDDDDLFAAADRADTHRDFPITPKERPRCCLEAADKLAAQLRDIAYQKAPIEVEVADARSVAA